MSCCFTLSHAVVLLQTTDTTSGVQSILARAPGKSTALMRSFQTNVHSPLIFVRPAQPSVAGSMHLGLGENTPRASLDASGRRLQGSVTRTSFAHFPVARLTVCPEPLDPVDYCFCQSRWGQGRHIRADDDAPLSEHGSPACSIAKFRQQLAQGRRGYPRHAHSSSSDGWL